uniref:Innexin n=1 Tax=Biomphalaria glabrata TaxID=6526 RepID=A0A2C9KI46_BIOGL
MARTPRSPFEDSVDHYNHTWLVSFLLVLAAFTLLIPLALRSVGKEAPKVGDVSSIMSGYATVCWCPAYFTGSMVTYAHNVCQLAFVSVSTRRETGSHAGETTEIDNEYIPAELFIISNLSDTQSLKRYAPDIKTESMNKNENIKQIDSSLVYITPVFLFACAVIFKCVYVLFVFYANSLGANMSSLILARKSVRSEQMMKDLAHVNSSDLRTSKRMAIGFIIYKLAQCTLCLAGILAVYFYLLPKATISNQVVTDVSDRSLAYKQANLLCEFSLAGRDVYKHTVQCSFTRGSSLTNDQPYVSLFWSVFTALLFALAFLALVNTINLTLWIVRLCCRRSTARSTKALSLDCRLLMCLMEEHLDLSDSQKLEEFLQDVKPGGGSYIKLTKETEDI